MKWTERRVELQKAEVLGGKALYDTMGTNTRRRYCTISNQKVAPRYPIPTLLSPQLLRPRAAEREKALRYSAILLDMNWFWGRGKLHGLSQHADSLQARSYRSVGSK